MNARLAVIATTYLLLASAQMTAQAPPNPQDYDQRLRALEDKIDRVLTALQARDAARPPGESSGGAVDAAREQVARALEIKEQEFREFQRRGPAKGVGGTNGTNKIYAERLGTIERRRSELKMKLHETTDRLNRVQKVFKDEGRKAAQKLIAAAESRIPDAVSMQLMLELIRLSKTYGPHHPKVKEARDAIAMVKKILGDKEGLDVEEYSAEVKAEINLLAGQIATLDALFDSEAKAARDLNVYEVTETKYRSELDRLRQALAGLDAVVRGEMPPAK